MVSILDLRVKPKAITSIGGRNEVASKTRQKKMSELDPFFNDEALVKGITKDSRRIRPYGTVCVMPKYTSAIGNELVYCGTKSPLGMCNRKGTSTETSCRGLWVKHISPDEQSAFVTYLRTLPSDDFEGHRERFAEMIKTRIYGRHREYVHANAIQQQKCINELHGSLETMTLQHSTELEEITPVKNDERSRTPLDKKSRSKFLGLGKDALIDMIVQANVDADEKMEKLKKEKTELCDTLNTIREYFTYEESKKYKLGSNETSTWRRFLDNLNPVSVEIKSILDRVQKEKLQEENTKLRDVLDEIDTHTAQLSVDLDWTNCGFLKQYWDEFKEDISKQKSTLNTVIENTVEADELKKYKEENKKLCQALEKILVERGNQNGKPSMITCVHL
ncbi:unnamed protein product [Bathycoccus prasinos]